MHTNRHDVVRGFLEIAFKSHKEEDDFIYRHFSVEQSPYHTQRHWGIYALPYEYCSIEVIMRGLIQSVSFPYPVKREFPYEDLARAHVDLSIFDPRSTDPGKPLAVLEVKHWYDDERENHRCKIAQDVNKLKGTFDDSLKFVLLLSGRPRDAPPLLEQMNVDLIPYLRNKCDLRSSQLPDVEASFCKEFYTWTWFGTNTARNRDHTFGLALLEIQV